VRVLAKKLAKNKELLINAKTTKEELEEKKIECETLKVW